MWYVHVFDDSDAKRMRVKGTREWGGKNRGNRVRCAYGRAYKEFMESIKFSRNKG